MTEPLTPDELRLLRLARSLNGGLADASPVETIDRLLATLDAARTPDRGQREVDRATGGLTMPEDAESDVKRLREALDEYDAGHIDAWRFMARAIDVLRAALAQPLPAPTLDVLIRATHPAGFRSGEWARIEGVQWANGRPCYRVRFPDGATDSWVISDPSDPYEFAASEPPAR